MDENNPADMPFHGENIGSIPLGSAKFAPFETKAANTALHRLGSARLGVVDAAYARSRSVTGRQAHQNPARHAADAHGARAHAVVCGGVIA
jgi:hypothetical protein